MSAAKAAVMWAAFLGYIITGVGALENCWYSRTATSGAIIGTVKKCVRQYKKQFLHPAQCRTAVHHRRSIQPYLLKTGKMVRLYGG